MDSLKLGASLYHLGTPEPTADCRWRHEVEERVQSDHYQTFHFVPGPVLDAFDPLSPLSLLDTHVR